MLISPRGIKFIYGTTTDTHFLIKIWCGVADSLRAIIFGLTNPDQLLITVSFRILDSSLLVNVMVWCEAFEVPFTKIFNYRTTKRFGEVWTSCRHSLPLILSFYNFKFLSGPVLGSPCLLVFLSHLFSKGCLATLVLKYNIFLKILTRSL
jgi:hypothetical protein